VVVFPEVLPDVVLVFGRQDTSLDLQHTGIQEVFPDVEPKLVPEKSYAQSFRSVLNLKWLELFDAGNSLIFKRKSSITIIGVID